VYLPLVVEKKTDLIRTKAAGHRCQSIESPMGEPDTQKCLDPVKRSRV